MRNPVRDKLKAGISWYFCLLCILAGMYTVCCICCCCFCFDNFDIFEDKLPPYLSSILYTYQLCALSEENIAKTFQANRKSASQHSCHLLCSRFLTELLSSSKFRPLTFALTNSCLYVKPFRQLPICVAFIGKK